MAYDRANGEHVSRETLAAILGYCRAQSRPMAVIHTPQHSTIGGYSCWLIEIGDTDAEVEIANGDRRTVPLSQITVRLA